MLRDAEKEMKIILFAHQSPPAETVVKETANDQGTEGPFATVGFFFPMGRECSGEEMKSCHKHS